MKGWVGYSKRIKVFPLYDINNRSKKEYIMHKKRLTEVLKVK